MAPSKLKAALALFESNITENKRHGITQPLPIVPGKISRDGFASKRTPCDENISCTSPTPTEHERHSSASPRKFQRHNAAQVNDSEKKPATVDSLRKFNTDEPESERTKESLSTSLSPVKLHKALFERAQKPAKDFRTWPPSPNEAIRNQSDHGPRGQSQSSTPPVTSKSYRKWSPPAKELISSHSKHGTTKLASAVPARINNSTAPEAQHNKKENELAASSLIVTKDSRPGKDSRSSSRPVEIQQNDTSSSATTTPQSKPKIENWQENQSAPQVQASSSPMHKTVDHLAPCIPATQSAAQDEPESTATNPIVSILRKDKAAKNTAPLPTLSPPIIQKSNKLKSKKSAKKEKNTTEAAKKKAKKKETKDASNSVSRETPLKKKSASPTETKAKQKASAKLSRPTKRTDASIEESRASSALSESEFQMSFCLSETEMNFRLADASFSQLGEDDDSTVKIDFEFEFEDEYSVGGDPSEAGLGEASVIFVRDKLGCDSSLFDPNASCNQLEDETLISGPRSDDEASNSSDTSKSDFDANISNSETCVFKSHFDVKPQELNKRDDNYFVSKTRTPLQISRDNGFRSCIQVGM